MSYHVRTPTGQLWGSLKPGSAAQVLRKSHPNLFESPEAIRPRLFPMTPPLHKPLLSPDSGTPFSQTSLLLVQTQTHSTGSLSAGPAHRLSPHPAKSSWLLALHTFHLPTCCICTEHMTVFLLHSLSQGLLRAYYVPGTVLATTSQQKRKQTKILH